LGRLDTFGMNPAQPVRCSRRDLLRRGAGLAGVAAIGGTVAGCGGGGKSTAAGSAARLKLWWWGEQEAVGITRWLDDTLAKFKGQSGVAVEPTLMDTDNVIPQFTTAAAAGNVPDLQFFFNGIYHMENAWLGYISPLNELLPEELLKRSGGTRLSVSDGKQYRAGFYANGFGVAYNKALFEKAKLDPELPPRTWDELLEACEKLKAAGITPIGGGVKDGYFGEWYLVNTLTQNLDSPAEALNLFIGSLDWRDPRYHDHWVRLEELHRRGYINPDITSLELYQGTQLYDTGKAAMCLSTTAALPASQKNLGAEKVGYFVCPVCGKGKLAGIPISDTQGFGIPAKAAHPQEAAKLLEFMHQPEQVQSMWTLAHQIPADESFDASAVDDPLMKTVVERWIHGKHNVYIANLMPTLFWKDAMFVISQKILAGEMTGAQSADRAAEITRKWKSQNPDLLERYGAWAKELGRV
jgi:raffinose/stachyose/melibiose transport system substrate-binding protein